MIHVLFLPGVAELKLAFLSNNIVTIPCIFNLTDVGVLLGFYGSSTHFRSFRVRSVNLATLILGKPPRQFTST